MNSVFSRGWLAGVLIVAFCLLVLLLDLNTSLGVAVGVAYILPVLVASQVPGIKTTIIIAILCSELAVIGLFVSPEGGSTGRQ